MIRFYGDTFYIGLIPSFLLDVRFFMFICTIDVHDGDDDGDWSLPNQIDREYVYVLTKYFNLKWRIYHYNRFN